MKVTSAHVAERAGVSRATVSYVLNDVANQTISARTREAVLAAARELGYRPNAAARALRTGYSPIVLCPLPGLNFAMDEVMVSLAGRLGASGLTLVSDFTALPSVEDQLTAWLRLQPAVVLDLGTADRRVIERLRASGVPILAPQTADGSAPLDVIGERIRAEQLRYLLERGCREILMVCPDPASGSAAYDVAMFPRLHALVTSGGGRLSVHRSGLDRPSLAAIVDAWTASDPRPDAICAYNDVYAIAMLTDLRGRGVTVPGDVAIIGSDNTQLGPSCSPTLTSVTAAYGTFAEQAGAAIEALIAGHDTGLSIDDVPVTVLRRESA